MKSGALVFRIIQKRTHGARGAACLSTSKGIESIGTDLTGVGILSWCFVLGHELSQDALCTIFVRGQTCFVGPFAHAAFVVTHGLGRLSFAGDRVPPGEAFFTERLPG